MNTPGTSVITIIIHANYEEWREYADDYKKGIKGKYNKRKEEIASSLIDKVEEEVIPGLRDMIEVIEVGTPLTNERFTGNYKGAVTGFRGTPSQYIKDALTAATPVQGLYIASAWARPGAGQVNAALSGKLAFDTFKNNI